MPAAAERAASYQFDTNRQVFYQSDHGPARNCHRLAEIGSVLVVASRGIKEL